MRSETISGELLKLRDEIRGYAVGYGLDFFEVIYEVCDYDMINILAAQGGFPTRYPHWRFGMEYDQLSKNYAYGLGKIYEMVINTDPCYAYLLKGNHWVDQKIVMAHVYGHSDFFKNNDWFKGTNRRMIDVMANHGAKIRRYMEKHGQDTVENFIDRVLSLENLLDVHRLFESPELARQRKEQEEKLGPRGDDEGRYSSSLQSYMRSAERGGEGKKEEEKEGRDLLTEKIDLPERDILLFLIQHAPLYEWQADIVGILREEAYYFLPQRMTKIMNEGWASYWHEKIMTEKAVTSRELVDFADHHAGVLVMNSKQINPYKVGIELYHDIEYRWDRGMFGKDFNECQDMVERENWNTQEALGREKIFELRKSYNDVSFIDEFLTPEFCERQKLFTIKYNPRTGRNEVDLRDFEAIKQKMLSSLANFGAPLIEVEDANFANRGELLLAHRHHGVDLDMQYAQETMRNIHYMWKRPVNLVTVYDDKEITFHFDGKELKPLSK